MTASQTSPSRTTRLRRLGLAALLTAGTAACSFGGDSQIACGSLPLSDADATVLVLTDQKSPALEATIDVLAADPENAFAANSLGIAAVTGMVWLGTYDTSGRVTVLAKHNLAPGDGDAVRASGIAGRHANCLQDAVDAMPPATLGVPELPRDDGDTSEPGDTGPRPDLLRTLNHANELLSGSGSEETATIVIGFSRSETDNFKPAIADLDGEAAAAVVDVLVQNALLSPFKHPMVFIAPDEGVTSEIAASDIRHFTQLMCAQLTAQCAVQAELN